MDVHLSIIRAIDEIDAAIFSGNTFLDEENNAKMQKMLDRWQRELNEHKKIIEELKEKMKDWKKVQVYKCPSCGGLSEVPKTNCSVCGELLRSPEQGTLLEEIKDEEN